MYNTFYIGECIVGSIKTRMENRMNVIYKGFMVKPRSGSHNVASVKYMLSGPLEEHFYVIRTYLTFLQYTVFFSDTEFCLNVYLNILHYNNCCLRYTKCFFESNELFLQYIYLFQYIGFCFNVYVNRLQYTRCYLQYIQFFCSIFYCFYNILIFLLYILDPV